MRLGWPFRIRRLEVRLALAALGIEAMMVLALCVAALHTAESRLVEEIDRRNALINGSLAVTLAIPLMEKDYAQLGDALAGMRQVHHFDYMAIEDYAGRAVLDDGWTNGRPLPPANCDARAALSQSGYHYDCRLEISFGGQVYGILQYGQSAREIIEARWRLIRSLVSAGLLIVVLSVPLFVIMGWMVTRSLRGLTRGAEAVAAGDFGTPIPVASHDEVGRLTVAFNDMAGALQVRMAELEHSNLQLGRMAEQLEFALEGSGVGMWDWEVQTGRAIFDDRWAEIVGWTLDELRPLTIETRNRLCHPDDLARSDLARERHFSGQADQYVCEVRMLHKSGSWVWVLDRGKVVTWDQQRRPLRMAGTHLDITERKRAEAELREQRDLFLSGSVVFIKWRVGIDGPVEFVSANVVDMLGHDPLDLITGKVIYADLIPVEDRARVEAEIAAAAATGISHFEHGPYRLRHRNGHQIWIHDHTYLVRSEAGAVTHYISYLIDITNSKRLEEALRQSEAGLTEAKERAEQANAAKSRFLATMSHEIRTPITGVLGMADLLLRTRLDDEQRLYVNTLSSSTNTLLTILNDILDLSKIESGKMSLEAVDFDPATSLREVTDLNRGVASRKGIALELALGAGIPEAVIGDPARFRQVALNLIGNAVKFTEQGRVGIRLSVAAAGAGTVRLLTEIEDTGIGIPAEQASRLFAPFSQLDPSTTRRFGGTGLGLAISRKLVELMGGTIGVDSVPGRGSRFWFETGFRIGASPVAPASPKQTVDPSVPETIDAPSGSLRILLAEDNVINQMLIRKMLEKRGHRVEVAGNGRLAVEAVRSETFDVVLMDMQMPEMDGEEATGLIRALPAPKGGIPVLALTADVVKEHRQRYLDAGIDDFIPKPIDWETLFAAIQRLTAEPGRAGSPS
jgi:PAS domain S-box-containing protein